MVLGEVVPSNRPARRMSTFNPKAVVAISACVAIVFVFSVVNVSGTTRFTQLVAALSPDLQLKVASTQAKAAASEAKAADAQAKAAKAETAEALSKVAVAEAKAAEAEARAALVEALVGFNETTTVKAAATTAAAVTTAAATTQAATASRVAATAAATPAAAAPTTTGHHIHESEEAAHPTGHENEHLKEKDMQIGVRFFNPECRESLMEMGRQMRNQSCTNAEQVAADILFGLAFKTGADPDTVREFCKTPCIERIVVIASKTVKVACDLQGSRSYFAKIMEACPEHIAAAATPTAAK